MFIVTSLARFVTHSTHFLYTSLGATAEHKRTPTSRISVSYPSLALQLAMQWQRFPSGGMPL